MANEDNLVSLGDRTTEEQRQIATMGGIASGKARREKKLMKDQMALLLSMPLMNEDLKEKIKELGIAEEDIDNQMAIVMAMWQKAIKGNVKASEFIRDTLGEKMPDKFEVNASIGEVSKEIENYVDTRKK